MPNAARITCNATDSTQPVALSTAPAPSRRRAWLGALALAAAVALAYGNTFTVPFLFDDEGSIMQNDSIRGWRTAFFPPGDKGDTVSGRPLLNASLALNYAISGTSTWSYHLFNMLIHLASGLALFGLAGRTLAGPRAGWGGHAAFFCALVAAALWLLHPLQTESVTYVVQRAESLMTMWYLLTLYCFARGTLASGSNQNPHGRNAHATLWIALSVICCALGMASKEVMVSAPAIVFLYDRAFVAGSFGAAWRARRKFYAALCATWLVLAACQASSGFRGGTAGFDTPVTWWIYAITQCKAILIYLKLVFWPSPLVFDYGVFFYGSPSLVLPHIIVVALLVAAALAALLVFPRAGIFGALFFAALAPSSSFVPIVTQTMAGHRMHLPSAAVITGAVVACAWFARGRPRLAKAGLAAACAVAVALGMLTWRRNQVFHDELSVWLDTVKKMPGNHRAQNNTGRLLISANRCAEGVPYCLEAARLKPNFGSAWSWAGLGLFRQGRHEEAIPLFQKAVFHLRGTDLTNLDNVYLYLGMALHQAGRDGDARAAFEEGIVLNPSNVSCLNNLGNCELLAGRHEAAEKLYRRALAITPGLAAAHDGLGDALARQGRVEEARRHYEEAIRLDPGLARARTGDAARLRPGVSGAAGFLKTLELAPESGGNLLQPPTDANGRE